MRVHADAVAVGRALIAALLFVGKRAASFSEAKFDDSVFGSVLRRRRMHWTFVTETSESIRRESDWRPDIRRKKILRNLAAIDWHLFTDHQCQK